MKYEYATFRPFMAPTITMDQLVKVLDNHARLGYRLSHIAPDGVYVMERPLTLRIRFRNWWNR